MIFNDNFAEIDESLNTLEMGLRELSRIELALFVDHYQARLEAAKTEDAPQEVIITQEHLVQLLTGVQKAYRSLSE